MIIQVGLFLKNNFKRYSNKISLSEDNEVKQYIKIFKDNNFKEHYEVNVYISQNKLWDDFSNIRSLNDHGDYKEIPGILPKFYAIICKELDIDGAGGHSLDKANPY